MKTVGRQKFTQIRLDITFDEHRSTGLLNMTINLLKSIHVQN